jgi:pilus assembly protein Flp/PilA
MKKLLSAFVAFARDEEGLTIVEYAVAASLITGAVSAAFTALGTAVQGQISEVTGYIL